MLRKYVKDLVVDPERLKGKNENQKFKIIYGPERLEAFKKYRARFPEDLRDMNAWIKPFFENEYYDPQEFDDIIKNIKEEDERRREERNLNAVTPTETPEERAARLRREELALAEGRNITPKVESDGLEYLGADAKYRVYKATNYTGAHNFALPRSEGKGWCITGSGYWGSGPSQGPSYWRSQVGRTEDNAFYFFMTTPAKDSYCVFIEKGSKRLRYVPNATDSETYTLPVSANLPLDIAGLGDNATKTTMVRKAEGPFYERGNTLVGLTEEGQNMDFIMIRADFTVIGDSAITGSRNLKELSITSNTKLIKHNGISGNINLKEIKFQGSEIEFESYALCNNGSLIQLNFPSASNVSPGILRDCVKLQRVTLPDNVTTIGERAFDGCKSLITVYIPSTCTNIGENAFNGCRNLVIKADFAEKPEGWYKNLESHVKAVHFLQEPEVEAAEEEIQEEPTQDSAIQDSQFVIKKKGDNVWFFAGNKDIPDETAYIDFANKYNTLQDAEDWAEEIYGKDWRNECEIVEINDFKNGVKIQDVKPRKGENKEDFIARFMSETAKEYPDTAQRYAIANSYWDRRKKVKDSEMVIDTNEEEKPLEIKEDPKATNEVAEFTVQTFVKEAIDDLKSAKTDIELNSKYDSWIIKSDNYIRRNMITLEQQEAFEDELWDIYLELKEKLEG